MNSVDQAKKLVGEEAAKYVQDGMMVGLGTGSTVYWTIKKLGKMVQEGLNITAIPTSNATAKLAMELGIPLTNFSEVQELDLAIDGADEVDENMQLIKGGGGALYREKVVAAAAKEFIVIVDETKLVKHLGRFPLPVEVVPFGWEITVKRIEEMGCRAALRHKNGKLFITDNHNYILDCHFGEILDPAKLHRNLIQTVGVVETGLFVDMADKVIAPENGNTRIITKS